MAIGQVKVNGKVAAGAFYGYQPLVVKIADSGSGFTAASGGTSQSDPLVEGGYDKAVRGIQQVASVVWMGAQTNASVTAIVDAATCNLTELKAAVAAATGISASNLTVTTSSTLNGAGTFTFA